MCSEAAEEGCTSKSLEVAAAQLALKTTPIILKTCSVPGSTYYYIPTYLVQANMYILLVIVIQGFPICLACDCSIREASLMLMYTL